MISSDYSIRRTPLDLFLDTADIAAIRRAAATGLLAGVTTNPSFVAATGRPLHEAISEICALVRGPVNAEVMAENADAMVEEARELATLAPNITVKIPMTVEG